MGPDSIWLIKINLIITSEKEKSRRRGRYPKLKQRKVRPCSQGTCWTTSSWCLQSWLLRRNLLELLECKIGIIASETMPKIVVLCCASGAAMRIQSERRLLWWNIWRISLSGSLTPGAVIDERREFRESSTCAKWMLTGRGGDFCGYNDRTSGRWRAALLPTEDGLGLSTRWN